MGRSPEKVGRVPEWNGQCGRQSKPVLKPTKPRSLPPTAVPPRNSSAPLASLPLSLPFLTGNSRSYFPRSRNGLILPVTLCPHLNRLKRASRLQSVGRHVPTTIRQFRPSRALLGLDLYIIESKWVAHRLCFAIIDAISHWGLHFPGPGR